MSEVQEKSSVKKPKTEEKDLTNNTNNSPEQTVISENLNKKNNSAKIVPIICGVVFLILLVTLLATLSSPKFILKNTINKTYKEVQNIAKNVDNTKEKFDLKKKAIILSGDLKFDGNLEDVDFDFSEYKVGFELGLKPSTESLTAKANVSKGNEVADLKFFFDEDGDYLTSSLFKGVLELENVTKDFDDIFELLEQVDEYDIELKEYTDVGKYIIKSINKNLDKESITKEREELEIDGKTIKVNKITYDLSGKRVSKLVRAVLKDLRENDKFIDRCVKLFNKINDEEMKKSDLKDLLDEMIDEVKDEEVPKNTSVSIYTKGLLNKFVGGVIVSEKEKLLEAYVSEDNSEIVIYDGDDKIKITASKEGKETKVVIKENKEKLGEATIRELSREKIDFDFTMDVEGEEIKLGLYLTSKETKNKLDGDYKLSLSSDGESLSFSGSYAIESKDDLDKVDDSDIINIDELDFEEIKENASKVFGEEIVDSFISGFEDELYDYNIIDMINLADEKEALNITKKKKGVLYVGSTYYSSYSNEGAATLLESLTDLQDELNFHSYYLNEVKVTENFLTSIGEVDTICKIKQEVNNPLENGENEQTPSTDKDNKTCQEKPTIYLVKDGKVVKALRGAIEKEELKNYLSEIGIE